MGSPQGDPARLLDNSGAVKPEKLPTTVEWILGYDRETETAKSVQRSIRLLGHWDDRCVLELGAIQLCSLQCRDEHMKLSTARMSAKA
jgi:hypothetical protein